LILQTISLAQVQLVGLTDRDSGGAVVGIWAQGIPFSTSFGQNTSCLARFDGSAGLFAAETNGVFGSAPSIA
jgi:hypothetical protein